MSRFRHRAARMAAFLVLFTAGCGGAAERGHSGCVATERQSRAGQRSHPVPGGGWAAHRRSTPQPAAVPRGHARTVGDPADRGGTRARLVTDVQRSAVPFSVTSKPTGLKVVTASVPVDELPDTAIDQIVCAVAEAGERVTVLGGGQHRVPRSCPVRR